MSNPFQDKLLKTGIVSKQQAHNAKKAKNKKNKQLRSQNKTGADQAKLNVKQAARDKVIADKALNKEKENVSRKKAVSSEIDQLITINALERKDDCDISYNFEHQTKVKHIYINNEMKQKIMAGTLVITYIQSHYELVPLSTAEKIQQRDKDRVVLFANTEKSIDANDPYAEYQIPDDLIW